MYVVKHANHSENTDHCLVCGVSARPWSRYLAVSMRFSLQKKCYSGAQRSLVMNMFFLKKLNLLPAPSIGCNKFSISVDKMPPLIVLQSWNRSKCLCARWFRMFWARTSKNVQVVITLSWNQREVMREHAPALGLSARNVTWICIWIWWWW